MESLKIAYLSAEAVPFAKTGGLADVSGSFPQALSRLGQEVKVFLPYHRSTREKNYAAQILEPRITARIGFRDIGFCLRHLKHEDTDFYFIENDLYFDREGVYGPPGKDYPDNASRFFFFSSAVLESLKVLRYSPDIIHGNEWHTAMAIFLVKPPQPASAFFQRTRTVFTIHNLLYQGLYGPQALTDLGIGPDYFKPYIFEFYGKINFMKAGIVLADAITTVSKGYAREILTEKFGCGLEGVLKTRQADLCGIVNGVDYRIWNPSTDTCIAANYDSADTSGKSLCKKDLLLRMNLRPAPEAPLLGNIGRLVPNKGIDLIIASVPAMVKEGFRLVLLGEGEEVYQQKLKILARRFPEQVAVRIGYDNELSHRIEAGSDIFIMPSSHEPCGLNQLYSLKYGTIPVVAAVGGLDDTIVDYTSSPNAGNGFKFQKHTRQDFLKAMARAAALYQDRAGWQRLMERAMRCDFSWERSAAEYLAVYKTVLGRRP